MSKTILEGLFEYFAHCPLMSNGRLNIDFLPESASNAGVEYAISTTPTEEVIYTYTNGGARCRYLFTISSVNSYGADEGQNLLNSGFFESLSEWLRQQTRKRNLPTLPDGFTPREIQAISTGYLYMPDVNAGKYQIQCELEYHRKGAF